MAWRSLGSLALLALAACPVVDVAVDDPRHPVDTHSLLPLVTDSEEGQIAAGKPTGRALEQPIAFPHYTHAVDLQMDCQFCHSEARKSIHSGVPPVQTCMNCHQHVKRDAPEPQKIWGYCAPEDTSGKPVGLRQQKKRTGEIEWTATRIAEGAPVVSEEIIEKVDYPAAGRFSCTGEPIPWKKVHDLPDYVIFSHQRHIKGGLQCTECHGQVALMGKPERVRDEAGNVTNRATEVMVRETTLQMGWCIDCHGTHPSIDENYGEMADLRRAELKDCWNCHK